MKHTKTIDVPASVKTFESHVTCDICGETIKPEGRFEVRDVQISYKRGTNHGNDGGDTLTDEIDCCVDCFVAKVKPAIEALGATFSTTEYDW